MKKYLFILLRGSELIGWVFVFALIGVGLGWILTIGKPLAREETHSDSSNNSEYESSYSHCFAEDAEIFLYKRYRSIDSQLYYVKLIAEDGNIFTFVHVSTQGFRRYECITKVICLDNYEFEIYDTDCKNF